MVEVEAVDGVFLVSTLTRFVTHHFISKRVSKLLATVWRIDPRLGSAPPRMSLTLQFWLARDGVTVDLVTSTHEGVEWLSLML